MQIYLCILSEYTIFLGKFLVSRHLTCDIGESCENRLQFKVISEMIQIVFKKTSTSGKSD